jgi:hypothetical protein
MGLRRRGLGPARISAHAFQAMRRRGIRLPELRRALAEPDERVAVRPGRVICQILLQESDRRSLLRVVVDVDQAPPRVLTAYRTSRVARYRRQR